MGSQSVSAVHISFLYFKVCIFVIAAVCVITKQYGCLRAKGMGASQTVVIVEPLIFDIELYKVKRKAKIRSNYNQIPHSTLKTKRERSTHRLIQVRERLHNSPDEQFFFKQMVIQLYQLKTAVVSIFYLFPTLNHKR